MQINITHISFLLNLIFIKNNIKGFVLFIQHYPLLRVTKFKKNRKEKTNSIKINCKI